MVNWSYVKTKYCSWCFVSRNYLKQNFFQGVTLPVPATIEPLESKLPDKVLQNLAATDFLKVNFGNIMTDIKLTLSSRFRNVLTKTQWRDGPVNA